MLVQIFKTEMREIKLTAPKYVCFADSGYYRFVPVKDNIETCSFQESNGNFELNVRTGLYDAHIGILELTKQYTVEITENEFDTKLQEFLLKYI